MAQSGPPLGCLRSFHKAAYRSGWGTLSAGSHPVVPEKEQARIGLILAFELVQLLILKYENWKKNGYRAFSQRRQVRWPSGL